MKQFSIQEENKREAIASGIRPTQMGHVSAASAIPPTKNANIVSAVLSLVKELNEQSLETIKRDIDRKLLIHHKKQQ